ncbi:ABC transporter ATP-binding protein [Eubacterium multiforme]|uniref:ABC-type Fe3+/spermidine/putrescine transport system ATPase subunit n=1 Tax=Eubacterium multiforme TaxID=83339 RepID=A0ABT9UTT6_9FIRM|nr:ATP-binding cassette domain-containing protein [Eubacterium multiforme]MDQ0149748.1 ABC-type Fe3+/spermidine/putrescine transport system ATPase subunit [Eubacterium multiforme]
MLEIKNINLKLGEFSLKNINLTIENGEYFVILGASGNGKTVFLETLSGMYENFSGKIIYNEKIISNIDIEKRKIGFVYQKHELFPFLNVQENIAFGLKVKGEKKHIIKEKVDKYLKIFKIDNLKKRYPKNLSGGESQRVALARALITSPDILLLDEPLSALDKITKDILIEEIKNINKNFKTTVIHVTHDINEALALGDNIGIMKDGNLKHIMTIKKFKDEFEKGNYENLLK